MSGRAVPGRVPTRERSPRAGASTALASLLLLAATLACNPSETTVAPDRAGPETEHDGTPESPDEIDDDADSTADAATDPAADPAAQTISFDGMDAPGGPEDEIRVAPQREDIESFEIFGVGGRGGPGMSLSDDPDR